MKNVQTFLDKSAISISLLCIAHCLLLPIAVTIIPVLSVLPLQDELFHKLLVIAILPTSLIRLVIGCRKHKRWRIASYGIFGVAVVIVAALFGHDLVGEFGEKLLTLIGSLFIVGGHIQNYRLCRQAGCH